MGLLNVIHEDNSSLDNYHFDLLQLVRVSIGLALTPNEVNSNAYNTDLDLMIHVEEDIEPPDADLPLGAMVMWMETVGMTRRVRMKYKDAGGTLFTGSLGLLT